MISRLGLKQWGTTSRCWNRQQHDTQGQDWQPTVAGFFATERLKFYIRFQGVLAVLRPKTQTYLTRVSFQRTPRGIIACSFSLSLTLAMLWTVGHQVPLCLDPQDKKHWSGCRFTPFKRSCWTRLNLISVTHTLPKWILYYQSHLEALMG